MSNNCCIQFTLLNPSTGVSLFFENFQRGDVEGGWILVGLFQGFVCHLPVRCFKCVGNCVGILMGFQILLNCSDSKFEEKWGLVVTY